MLQSHLVLNHLFIVSISFIFSDLSRAWSLKFPNHPAVSVPHPGFDLLHVFECLIVKKDHSKCLIHTVATIIIILSSLSCQYVPQSECEVPMIASINDKRFFLILLKVPL